MLIESIRAAGLKTSRRSVLTVSLLILLIAATSIRSDALFIFGLEIEFDKLKLIATLQIVLLYVFPIFFLNYLSAALHFHHSAKFKKDKAWEKERSAVLREIDNFDPRDDGYEPEPEDWWEKFVDEISKREKRRKILLQSYSFIKATTSLLVDFIAPTILAYFAFFHPSALYHALELWTEKSSRIEISTCLSGAYPC